ncbi:acyl-CoA dehydrogenase domain-containing protein, partial [mine drainage metagenome]
ADRGGRGRPAGDAGRLLYRLAYRAGTAFAKLALQPEFCSVLLDHGTDPLGAAWGRPLLEGRRLVGNHLTEPGSGADAQALRTSARREGDEYVLDGTKSEAAFAADADAAIVYARVGEAPGGITAFLVPQDRPGVVRRIAPVDLGERWQRRGTVEYRAVRVPVGYRLGEE